MDLDKIKIEIAQVFPRRAKYPRKRRGSKWQRWFTRRFLPGRVIVIDQRTLNSVRAAASIYGARLRMEKLGRRGKARCYHPADQIKFFRVWRIE